MHQLLIICALLFLLRCGPTRAMASSFLRFLDHTLRRTTWVGLFWTSDRPVAETSTRQHTTLTTLKLPCPWRDSKPTVSAEELQQTYALDRAATGTGDYLCICFSWGSCIFTAP